MHDLIAAVLEEIRGAWRYRWHALACAWLICVLGWFVVLSLPNRFEARARLFVDPTTALKPVIQGIAIEQDLDAELNLVRQSMLSDPQLRKVVEKTSLGARTVSDSDRMEAVRTLRTRILLDVQSTAATRMDQPPSSKLYVLSYQDSDRQRALSVIDMLLSSFVEGTLGGKREGAQRAQEFLEGQIKDYEQRLAAAEQRLAEFKKKNVGMVPGEQQGDFFSRLQQEMDAAKQAQAALSAAITRRDALQRQLRGEAPIAASAGASTVGPGGTNTGGVDTLSRIRETQARIDDLLLRFTDKHPDVVAARESLKQLQERRETEMAALRRGDANAAAVTGASSNPVYQNIQLSLNQAEVEVATQRAQLVMHQGRVTELRRYLDTMPQVEAEYARLTRDYTVTRAQYTSMAERLEKARVGEEADASGSVRFEVIDPPAADIEPVWPMRNLFLVGVLAFGLAAGAGLAYLLNMLNPVFSSSRYLEDVTGRPVLGTVGSIAEGAVSARRMEYMRLSTVAAALLVALAVVAFLGARYAPLGDLL